MSGGIPYIDQSIFAGKKVLLTGHSGFKGSWLSLWLSKLGAEVTGIALPPGSPSLFEATSIASQVDHRVGDITDPDELAGKLADVEPDVVIHFAAQSLVRESYTAPAATFLTNVSGTANVLDLVRVKPSVKAVVIATSDKCYENNDWHWGYRETDALGGSDPYSASKAATELVAQAYMRSFFSNDDSPAIATARAGNVFGGGDFAADRLVPDIARAAHSGNDMIIRNPEAVRPWQHVLEPLNGYLMLAAALLRDGHAASGAYNFGPDPTGVLEVGDFVRHVTSVWGSSGPRIAIGDPSKTGGDNMKEAQFLTLDSSKARQTLGWKPRMSMNDAVEATVAWYKAWLRGDDLAALTAAQIDAFETGDRVQSIQLAS